MGFAAICSRGKERQEVRGEEIGKEKCGDGRLVVFQGLHAVSIFGEMVSISTLLIVTHYHSDFLGKMQEAFNNPVLIWIQVWGTGRPIHSINATAASYGLTVGLRTSSWYLTAVKVTLASPIRAEQPSKEMPCQATTDPPPNWSC